MWLVLRGTPAVLCPATPATNLSWPVWWVGVLAVDVRKGRASTPNWTSMPSGCTTTWVSSLDWRDGARFDLDFCLTLTFTVCHFQITSCLMRSLKVSVHFTKFKHFSPTWLLTDVSCDITRGDVRSSAEPRLFASGPRLSLRDKWRPGHHEQRHRVMSLLLAMAGQSPVQRTPLLQWRTRPPALGPHCQTLQRQVRPQHWDICVCYHRLQTWPSPPPPPPPCRAKEDVAVLGIHDLQFLSTQTVPVDDVINLPLETGFPPKPDLSLLHLSVPVRLGTNKDGDIYTNNWRHQYVPMFFCLPQTQMCLQYVFPRRTRS